MPCANLDATHYPLWFKGVAKTAQIFGGVKWADCT